jgi:hypothetical protein
MKTTPQSKAEGQPENDLPRIGQPAVRALAGIGVYGLEQLTKFSENEIQKLHGMGPKALGILRQALADRGLSFRNQEEKPV